MINKLLKIIAVAQAIALPNIKLEKANNSNPYKGYEILEGQYCSEILVGDIDYNYNIPIGCHYLAKFSDGEKSFSFNICINENETVEKAYIDGAETGLIDWEKSGLRQPSDGEWSYIVDKSYFGLYFKKPLKATMISDWTKQYLSYTSPAREFAVGYDGFIPSFYYTSISGNKTYFESITSLSSLPTGKAWQSGDVSGYGIKINDFIIQNYYVSADILSSEKEYIVNLCAYAKSNDGQKSVNLIIQPRIGYVNLQSNINDAKTYYFPQPISTLTTTEGYYNIIRSSGAYGLTESVMNYQEGYKDGQGNPTFKSFIVSAFEACSAFFSLPVLGEHITIGTLIGAFVGLGALFLIIRLFR